MVCAVGEGYDSSDATPITPTRTRRDGETTVIKHCFMTSPHTCQPLLPTARFLTSQQ